MLRCNQSVIISTQKVYLKSSNAKLLFATPVSSYLFISIIYSVGFPLSSHFRIVLKFRPFSCYQAVSCVFLSFLSLPFFWFIQTYFFFLGSSWFMRNCWHGWSLGESTSTRLYKWYSQISTTMWKISNSSFQIEYCKVFWISNIPLESHHHKSIV